MSTVCQSTPTATQTQVTTTGVTSVATSTITTTSYADPITSTFSTCIVTGTASTATCSPTTITTVVTPTGAVVITTTTEVTAYIDSVVTNTVTLYSQACSAGGRSVSVPPTSSTRSIAGITGSITTPVVVTISGSKSTIFPASTGVNASSSSSSKPPIGAIVGGVVGGLALFAAVAFFGYKFISKKMALKRLNNMLDAEDDSDVKVKPDLYSGGGGDQNPPPPLHSQDPSGATTYGHGQYYQAQSPEMQQYPLSQQAPQSTGQEGYQFPPDINTNRPQNNNQYAAPPAPGPTGSPPPAQPYYTPGAAYPQQQQNQQPYPLTSAPSPPPASHGMMYDPNLGYAPPPPMAYNAGYSGYAEPSSGLPHQ